MTRTLAAVAGLAVSVCGTALGQMDRTTFTDPSALSSFRSVEAGYFSGGPGFVDGSPIFSIHNPLSSPIAISSLSFVHAGFATPPQNWSLVERASLVDVWSMTYGTDNGVIHELGAPATDAQVVGASDWIGAPLYAAGFTGLESSAALVILPGETRYFGLYSSDLQPHNILLTKTQTNSTDLVFRGTLSSTTVLSVSDLTAGLYASAAVNYTCVVVPAPSALAAAACASALVWRRRR